MEKTLLNAGNKSLLIIILTLGVCGIINTEMGVVGIIPLIANTFGVTIPEATHTVSIFALLVALSAPVMPRINRRKESMLQGSVT